MNDKPTPQHVSNLGGWFEQHGKLFSNKDPRGPWVRGYLYEIAEMMKGEVDAAYERGLKAGKRKVRK